MSDTATVHQPLPPRGPQSAHDHGMGKRHIFFVALPLLAMLGGAASMWHFVSFAIMSNPLLNGIIIAVLCWGMWTMVGHLIEMFGEDRVFRAGMRWLHDGDASGEQHPRLGPPAFVTGMLDRLQKLGLGHQVYIHSSAMEPEIEALEQYLNKRQELSQFLVGLMVGLGLLGTFVGLLETLVETSGLIATIAKSAGGGADMEGEFAKIVGGLQKPLSAMGTAFSASMFGLVGSIVLGFQMVAVRKAATDLIETVRGQVLSLAEKSSVNENVEISERFLATYVTDCQAPIAAAECFPLPGADPGQTPQRFPWARPQDAAGGNHQVLVLRLRDALADGMRRRVLQMVSQLNKQILDGLTDTFTTWSERLLMLSGNAPLLAHLVGESAAPDRGPEWKTAAVEYPLADVPGERVVQRV